MKSIRRIAIFTVLIALVAIGLASLVLSNENRNPQNQTESLKFRITWETYSGRGEALNKIVESFNAVNKTKYKIKLVGGDEDLTKIEALLAEGKSVDIYMLPYRYVQYLGYENHLMDLSQRFNESKNIFYPKLWQLGVVGDKVYGIPWLGHSMALVYNKQLLDKAHVDPAKLKSVEDLAAACKKVEKYTGAKGISLVGANHNDVSWMVNQFVYGFEGSLVSGDGTRVTVNSKSAREAILFYKNQLGKYAQKNWTNDTGVEAMDCFREQKVAFEIQGPWGVTDIWKNGNPFEVGSIPLKQIGVNPEVGLMMVSLKPQLTGDKREAAMDFIDYLISKKAQEMIMEGEYIPEMDAYYPFRIPVRKDIAGSDVFVENNEFVPFLSGYVDPSVDVPTPLWQRVKDEVYAPGLHKVMEGKLSVDDFLAQVQRQGNKILKSGK